MAIGIYLVVNAENITDEVPEVIFNKYNTDEERTSANWVELADDIKRIGTVAPIRYKHTNGIYYPCYIACTDLSFRNGEIGSIMDNSLYGSSFILLNHEEAKQARDNESLENQEQE